MFERRASILWLLFFTWNIIIPIVVFLNLDAVSFRHLTCIVLATMLFHGFWLGLLFCFTPWARNKNVQMRLQMMEWNRIPMKDFETLNQLEPYGLHYVSGASV